MARWLNRVCGTNAFHPWNVGEVPDVDLARLAAAVEMEGEFGN